MDIDKEEEEEEVIARSNMEYDILEPSLVITTFNYTTFESCIPCVTNLENCKQPMLLSNLRN